MQHELKLQDLPLNKWHAESSSEGQWCNTMISAVNRRMLVDPWSPPRTTLSVQNSAHGQHKADGVNHAIKWKIDLLCCHRAMLQYTLSMGLPEENVRGILNKQQGKALIHMENSLHPLLTKTIKFVSVHVSDIRLFLYKFKNCFKHCLVTLSFSVKDHRTNLTTILTHCCHLVYIDVNSDSES